MVSATVLHHQNQPSRSHTHAHSHTHRPRPLAINSHQNQQLAWQMPAVGIERLLELSASVPVPDGELTPVQAWDALRRHPEFGGLEVGRLKRLEERLVGGIKCYGYVYFRLFRFLWSVLFFAHLVVWRREGEEWRRGWETGAFSRV